MFQKISGVPTVVRSCVLSYPTQPDEEIALRTGSKVCLHLRVFISLISLGGLGFSPHLPLIFLIVKQALLLQQTLISSSFKPYAMNDVNDHCSLLIC